MKYALALALLLSSATAFAKGSVVKYYGREETGTIVISMKERALYFIYDQGRAIRYPVAVPKRGMEWSGYARINRKMWQPAWAPPAVVKRDHPELPDYIPGGSPDNPMGIAALLLDRDEIAIHGTTKKMRSSIGSSASYGCIRMLNEDVADLYERVSSGTLVLMKR